MIGQKETQSKLHTPIYSPKWDKRESLSGGLKVRFRPILPEDESLYMTFIQKSTMEDIRHRFFAHMKELPHDLLVQFTHVDYNKTMAFVAIDEETGDLLGVSRYAASPDSQRAEYAVMTRSDLKGHGIGFTLMRMLIEYAKEKNISELYGQIMRDSPEFIKMCKEFGFHITSDENDLCYLMTTLPLFVIL